MSFWDWDSEFARPSKSKSFCVQPIASLQTLAMPLSHKPTPVQVRPWDLLRRQASTLRFLNPQPKLCSFWVISKNWDNKCSEIGQIATKSEFWRPQMDLVVVNNEFDLQATNIESQVAASFLKLSAWFLIFKSSRNPSHEEKFHPSLKTACSPLEKVAF